MATENQLELGLCIAPGTSGKDNRVEIFIASRLSESPTGEVRLMESILEPVNMQKAVRRVMSNKGAPGVDGMKVRELDDYLRREWNRIQQSMLDGTYRPSPVRRVEIEKSGGGVRNLGIPTVVDRCVQQAVAQVLTQIWDHTFSDSSYGFRPGRSQHDAVKQCKRILEQGYGVCVDMDLSKFFDRVNHDRLMSRLATRITDKRVLKLIRAFLESGIMVNGLEEPSLEGTPQGGPLSPLLSNIVLDELDKELERRGLHFVRYADDFVIYVKSERAGERVKQSITSYITKKLRLKINVEKSAVGRPSTRKFLGFSFLVHKDEVRIRIHQGAIKRFKERVRELTGRNCGRSLQTVITQLKRYLNGWWNYYGLSDVLKPLPELSGWIRRRLRALIWKQWKNPRTRVRELLKRGVNLDKAKTTGNTRKGAWRISSSYYVHIALPNELFHTLGLIFPWEAPA